MKKLLRLLILFFVFGILVTCEKENNPPTIQNTTASPQTIKTGETTQLTCVATDPDGDQLTYSWSSSKGTFPSGTSGSSVSWKAPDEAGTYTISIVVSDGQNVVDGTLNVEIMETSEVEGHVYYSGTLIPVSGVLVSIDEVSFTTGESGYFLLQNVAVGNAEIKATKQNFDNFSKSITINETENSINIEMTSDMYTHNVSGYISDEDGNKLSGVIVSILNPDESVSNLKTTSDATGYYQLPSVPQGSRIIKFKKEGYPNFQAEIFISNSDYPYNAILESYKIFGSVFDFNGNSLSGVAVSILKTDGTQTNFKTTTDNIGYYQLKNVPQGNWIIVFEKVGFTPHQSDISVSYNDGNFEYSTKLYLPITDSRDDKTYKTVKIGNQLWMAENLAYDAGNGCYAYDNDESNVATYGRLYIWSVAMAGASSSSSNPSGVQGVCPDGWHLPSDAEWAELETWLGNNGHSGAEGTALKSTSGWNSDGNGTDDFGFSALPGGYRDDTSGTFSSVGHYGTWWSSTESNSSNAWYRYLYFSYTKFTRNYYNNKEDGFSVRCVRD